MDDRELGYRVAVHAAAVWYPRALALWMRALGSACELVRFAAMGTGTAPAGAEPLPASALARVARIDDACALAALRTARECGARLVVHGDKDYPAALDDLCDPPLVLYVRGSLASLGERAVAIVGSRAASSYGRSIAANFAAEFAAYGVTVVSGLARGIDAAAHRGALDAAAPTAAVLGSGIRALYPPYHALLADEIVDRNGVVLSEFPPEEPARAFQFPMRNRIVAALGHATIVVEAGPRSGALITARLADEVGRSVFAVPGDIGRPTSRGTNALIADGVPLITSASDVAALMHWTPSMPSLGSNAVMSVEKAPLDALVANLPLEGAAIDELAARCGSSASEIAARLTLLELRGVVERKPGGLYAPVRERDAANASACA